MSKYDKIKDVEKRYTGDELDFSNIVLDELDKNNRNNILNSAFRYYSYHKTNSAKRYLVKYAKHNKKFENIKFIKDNDIHYPTAWLCRMVTDCNLKPCKFVKEKIDYGFTIMMNTINIPKKDNLSMNKTNKFDKPKELVTETNLMVGLFEYEIDKFIENNCYNKDFNFQDFVHKNDLKPRQVSACKKVAKNLYDEVVESMSKNGDSQLKEAYKFLTKPQKTRLTEVFLKSILDTVSYTKTKTKVKEKKKIKQVANIAKSKIDGSTVVWIHYKKYNDVGVLVAKSGSTLYLKGKTIYNVDRESSFMKHVAKNKLSNVINKIKRAKNINNEIKVLDSINVKKYNTSTRFHSDKKEINDIIKIR